MGANPEYAEGEVVANKYVVEGLLGESPAARTFLANGNFGVQKFCLKFYRPEVSQRLLTAPDFFLKAGVMTEIEHDNLTACTDVQEEMGSVFVARAYAEGLSFEEWLRKARSDGNYFSRGLELLWQVSQGLTALHERTRHLNIHPGNIMVGPLVAKLCDWDPRALSNMEMTPEALPVRPEYLGYRAPEMSARGSFLSYPSTDLFAVAGLLFRLIKGDHPYGNAAQTHQEIRSFDKDLSVFLGKAMHPKPEERFQEAGAFSDALWDLGSAMQRLQERNARSAPPKPMEERRPVEPPPRKPDPMFQEPTGSSGFAEAFPGPSQSNPSGKEPTLAGLAKPPSGNDTFFNFFPSADAAPTQPQPPAYKAPMEAKPSGPSGDTLFGTPVFPSQRNDDFVKPAPPREYQAPAKSGMDSLESSGTLFGSQAPLFGSSAKQKPKAEPVKAAAAKPLAVSLSSLEKDPLDMAGGDATAGFTQFGFKGAGENRTGIFTPEQRAASAKTKLMIALAAVGGLILVLALGGLFLYLRGTTAPKVAEPVTAPAPVAETPVAANPEPQTTEPVPTPSAVTPSVKSPAAKPSANPAVAAEPPHPPTANPDKVPDMPPIQAEPEPGISRSEPRAAKAADEKPAARASGNSKVTPEREAALALIIQNRTWPASAAERLRAADDFNDLGKTAEANMAYAKALAAGDVNQKQKVSALGGLAVTFQSMGMHDQARDAVQQLLDINPKNGFALKLKAKLK
jgi:hypothetical protein